MGFFFIVIITACTEIDECCLLVERNIFSFNEEILKPCFKNVLLGVIHEIDSQQKIDCIIRKEVKQYIVCNLYNNALLIKSKLLGEELGINFLAICNIN